MSSEEEEASSGAWSISIKPVGAENAQSSEGGLSRDFVIEVSPEDDLTSLYERIEGVTGLKATQQRLIYRGRLIGASQSKVETSRRDSDLSDQAEVQDGEPHGKVSLKIKDITGLSDGHTIHLVRRRERDDENNQDTRTGGGAQRGGDPSTEDGDAFSASSSAAPLLAALLGLGSTDDGDDRSTDAGRRWRSARYGTSRRRFHHRLTQEDIEPADPGSMESVRQAMMTLHTLLPAARQPFVEQQQRPSAYPNRRWYVGQWIDCLDTVNQWLEATIVEIVEADDILPLPRPRPNASCPPSNRHRSTFSSGSEPLITAGDLDGRRRLLLEPCEEGDSDDEGGELSGFRRRDTNQGVQLLLIHYNGWPHRWDEWIRSDSERIRPFRVRTRHPNSSSQASPTPQSIFTEAPSTLMGSSESRDREALLPELCRVLTTVNELVTQAAANVEAHSRTLRPLDEECSADVNRANLPWNIVSPPLATSPQPADACPDEGTVEEESVQSEVSGEAPAPPAQMSAAQRAAISRRELAALAPVLDRLGRTLIDAAPHLAYLAASMAETEQSDSSPPELEPIEEHPTSLGGLLSLLSRDRRRQSIASNNVVVPSDNVSNNGSVQTGAASEESGGVDPDHSDFAAGLVNTTRGEVRRGPRSRSQTDDAAGILGAYLAAASLGGGVTGGSDNDDNDGNMQGLGRLLRERGNGGIDIHIHAVVTAPGMPTGALGLTTLGAAGAGVGTPMLPSETGVSLFSTGRRNSRGGTIATVNNHRSSSSVVAPLDDEDMGIFAELYSENPEPVNPNRASLDGDSSTGSGRRDANSTSRRSLQPQTSLGRTLSHSMNNNRRQLSSRSASRNSNSLEQQDSIRRNGSSGGGMFRRLFRRSNTGE